MGTPSVEITEEKRLKLCKFGAISGWLCLIPSVVFFILGIYIQVALDSTGHLLKGYNYTVFPVFLILLACFSFFAYAFGGQICIYTKNPERREKMARFLFVYVIITSVLSASVFLAGILCFAQISYLEDALTSGLSHAMNQYKDGTHSKIQMDSVQIEYKCCGNVQYIDWFTVDWVHEMYSFVPRSKKKNDDVPFSCCNPDSERPCIHTRITHRNAHAKYDPDKKLTIYREGCKDALAEKYGDVLLFDAAWTILGMSLLQFGSLVITRFLQTSVSSALQEGDTEATTFGFLFPFGEGLEGSRKATRKGDGEAEEMELLLSEQDISDDFFTDSTFDEESVTHEVEKVESRTEEAITGTQSMQLGEQPTTKSDALMPRDSTTHTTQELGDKNARFRRIANLIKTKNKVIHGFRRSNGRFAQASNASHHTYENLPFETHVPFHSRMSANRSDMFPGENISRPSEHIYEAPTGQLSGQVNHWQTPSQNIVTIKSPSQQSSHIYESIASMRAPSGQVDQRQQFSPQNSETAKPSSQQSSHVYENVFIETPSGRIDQEDFGLQNGLQHGSHTYENVRGGTGMSASNFQNQSNTGHSHHSEVQVANISGENLNQRLSTIHESRLSNFNRETSSRIQPSNNPISITRSGHEKSMTNSSMARVTSVSDQLQNNTRSQNVANGHVVLSHHSNRDISSNTRVNSFLQYPGTE